MKTYLKVLLSQILIWTAIHHTQAKSILTYPLTDKDDISIVSEDHARTTDSERLTPGDFIITGNESIPSITNDSSDTDFSTLSTFTTNGSSTTFSDPAAWDLGLPPNDGTADIVIDHNISLDENYTVANLTVNVNDTLRINPGIVLKVNGDIINNGLIYFESDGVNGSAQLDEYNGSVNDNIGVTTVERFIPAKRIYRFHSSTVNTAGGSKPSINDNWQEGATTTPPVEDPNPGFGTHITKYITSTGISGIPEDGFDESSIQNFNHSLLTYNNNLQRFRAWPDTDPGQLRVGQAFRLFVRGDRSIDINDPIAPPTNTILRSTGQLHTENFDFSYNHPVGFRRLSSVTSQINLVTNPYQSVVDYSEVTRTDLSNYINIWDANLGGAGDDETRGGYVTVEVPGAGGAISAPSPYSSAANHFIPPGRPFFVKNTGASPVVTFEEDDKATGNNTVNINTTDPDFYINSRVYKTLDLQDGNTESDALGLRFNTNYTNAASLDEDAPADLLNSRVNYKLADISLSTLWSIEKRKVPNMNDLIQLFIDYGDIFAGTDPETNNYSLTFDLGNKPDDIGVYLIDNISNTETELTGYTEYDFTIDDIIIPGSTDFFRFSLRFYDITYITVEGATDWNQPSSWRDNLIPPDDADVIIAHDLNLTDERTVQSITFISDATLTNSIQTLTIQDGGNIINDDGTETTIGGTVNFIGDGTVTGEVSLNDVEINADVNFNTQTTINGSLTINTNGNVDLGSPIYGPSSTLIYNSGNDSSDPYQRRLEWNNDGVQGSPANVILQNNTHLDMTVASDPNIAAVISGNLQITSGSALYMDYDNINMLAALEVGGNFLNEGYYSLSGADGGDLVVRGDFTDTGTGRNFNNRAIFFEGPNDQNLTAANNFDIPYVLIDKTAGQVILQQDIIINGDGGTGLNMSNEGVLNLNDHQLQIGDNTATQVSFSGNAGLVGSLESRVLFRSTSDPAGNLVFKQDAAAYENYLSEFEMDGSGLIGISDTLNILRRFYLKGGEFESNGHLTFKSFETTTAVIPEVTGGGFITGDVRIERHFPQSNRAFRYISSPVTTSTSINANWQEGALTPGNFNPNPGYGTHITGIPGTAGVVNANGLDETQTGNPSLFTFDETDQTNPWDPVTSTNNLTDVISVGEPYALMVRGDRSTSLNSNVAVGPATTLRTSGTIVTGSQSVASSVSSGEFVLVGNPYQARVDMNSVIKGNINQGYMWIFDPTLGTQGCYAIVDLSSGNQVDEEFAEVSPRTSQANEFLEPFQACFLEAVAPNFQFVSFQEEYKSEDMIDNIGTFSTATVQTNVLNIELEQQNTQILVDAAKLSFDSNFTTPGSFEDATKLWNSTEHLAIVNNSDYFGIDKRNLPQTNDTVPLYLGNYQESQYTLKLESTLESDIPAILYDEYLDQTLVLNFGDNTYDFSVDNAIPESTAGQRFKLVFNPETLGTEDLVSTTAFSVYPNPTDDILYINSDKAYLGQEVELTCFDQTGRLVLSESISKLEANTSLDLSTLSAGLYLLKLETIGYQETFKIQVR